MGGIHTTYPAKANFPGHVIVAGSFRPAGTGTPTAAKGSGFAVTRTAVGKYLVTFTEDVKFPTKVCVLAFIRAANDTITAVQGGDYSAANRTLALFTFVGGVLADLSADADSEVNFMVIADNDQVENAGDS